MKTVLPHTASDFSVEDEKKVHVRQFKVVSPEEFEAAMNAPMDALEEALEQGRQDRLAAEKAFHPGRIDPSLRFR